MEIKKYIGSLLDSKAQILVHQVNCTGRMASGIAKTIRETYPVVYDEYMEYCKTIPNPKMRLGDINIVKISRKQAVCNLFGQLNYGYDGKRYTSYDALADGFEKLRDFCLEKGVKSIAIPKNLGCGLGGGKWGIVSMIIYETFEKTNLEIETWEYNGTEGQEEISR